MKITLLLSNDARIRHFAIIGAKKFLAAVFLAYELKCGPFRSLAALLSRYYEDCVEYFFRW